MAVDRFGGVGAGASAATWATWATWAEIDHHVASAVDGHRKAGETGAVGGIGTPVTWIAEATWVRLPPQLARTTAARRVGLESQPTLGGVRTQVLHVEVSVVA